MIFTGFRGKMNFSVSEVSFEKLLKVLCFAYVFGKGEKCNCVLMSLDFVYFVFLGRGLDANELFVSEVDFENVVKVMGFAYVFEKGEKCNCLLMSLDFVYFVVVAKLYEKKFDCV